MITVEFDMDETCITIIDNQGELEDIQAFPSDDYCQISQWNENEQTSDTLILTAEMYYKLMKSFNLSEGAYILEKNYK